MNAKKLEEWLSSDPASNNSVWHGSAAERWKLLPSTPAPMQPERSGRAEANGISIYYAVYGEGSPVFLLHGGLANSDYWGDQNSGAGAAPYRDRDGQSRPRSQYAGFQIVHL